MLQTVTINYADSTDAIVKGLSDGSIKLATYSGTIPFTGYSK